MSKPKPTPDDVLQQVRSLRAEIGEHVTPMTPDQRRDLRDRTKRTPESIETAVHALDMSEKISVAIGRSVADVRDLMEATGRWGAVEGDLQSLLNGISSANLARRFQLGLIADQVFAVTKQLIRSPENAYLRPIYDEMNRLRKVERSKKKKTPDPLSS
jgi:hypothetical protein